MFDIGDKVMIKVHYDMEELSNSSKIDLYHYVAEVIAIREDIKILVLMKNTCPIILRFDEVELCTDKVKRQLHAEKYL